MATNEQSSIRGPVGLKVEYHLLPDLIDTLSEADFDQEPVAEGSIDSLDIYRSREAFWEDGAINKFAARYSGNLNVVTAGTYEIFLTTDDGASVYVDGKLVVSNDDPSLDGLRSGFSEIELNSGSHSIEIFYIENRGSQTLRLEWSGPDSGNTRKIISGGSFSQGNKELLGLKVEYHLLPDLIDTLSEADFDQEPVAEGSIDSLDIYRSREAFWEDGAINKFAARYSGNLNVVTAGTYEIFLTTDDGAAVYVDGNLVVSNDDPSLDGLRSGFSEIELNSGSHSIEIFYIENRGSQTLRLEWSGPDSGGARETITGSSLTQVKSKPMSPL
ncbi:PA14 domain-containing protein [uncultured Roseovarius sp.]|uniref:PA14 domain-containing protein n=1 Tax=uncultured Roseovarius sp. TaxID=293344 RepID=UPI0026138058|nr:PA14 domain-containing protein [uncultured Roseovarius sp.]